MKANIRISDTTALEAMQRIAVGRGTPDDTAAVTTYLRTPQGAAEAAAFVRSLAISVPSQIVLPNKSEGESITSGALVEADAERMAATLAGDNPTPAVAALAALAAAMHVRVLAVSARYDTALTKGYADAVRVWDKALTAATSRYVKALDTLARVQRYDVLLTEQTTREGDTMRSVRVR